MSVAVKKLDGVHSVNVSLNKGLVTIELAASNHLTLAELRRVITANGFSPKEATVVADGVLDTRSGTPTLAVDGTTEAFTLTRGPDAAAFDAATRGMAQREHVEISGRVDPPKGPERLAVASIKRLP